MGNLTRDPELKYTPSNTAVAQIGVAVNRRYRTSEGEQRDEVCFVDCEAWGRTAEIMNQYLQKGRPIFIEGRLKLDQWQDQEGNNRSKLKVVVESFQFVDSRADTGGGDYNDGDNYGGGSGRSRSPSSSSTQQRAPAAVDRQPVDEEDIPF